MEENGKEECCIWNGIGDIKETQVDLKFQGVLDLSNDALQPAPGIFNNHSSRLPERHLNEEETVKRMCSSGNDCVEELTTLLRNHYVENNKNDIAEVEKEDMTVRVERDQTCSRSITCSGNVSQSIASNNIEIISLKKEENITCKKGCGNGEPVCGSVNNEGECTSLVLKSNEPNNCFFDIASSDSNKKTEDISEAYPQESSDIVDIRFRVIPDEYQENCQFCTKNTTEVNDELIATKELNTAVMETESTEEFMCIICDRKSNKTKFGHDSKSENIERNEKDLMRSASRISDKSSNSNISGNSETKKKNKKEFALETDPGVLSRRQKQIEYGKNTTGYQRYKKMVSKDQRTRQDPQTPPMCVKYSRRAWDGLIKTWRRKLHNWDPPKVDESDDEVLSLISTSSFPTNSDDSENVNDTSSDLAVEEQSFTAETETNGTSCNMDADSLQTKAT